MIKMNVANLLGGSVQIEVNSRFPERILNICSARGIRFWDVKYIDAENISLWLSRGDYKRLKAAAEKFDGTINVGRRSGASYFAVRFRRRYVLAVGLLAAFSMLFAGSFFIWEFDITGNSEVSDEEIMRSLEKNGVTFGTYGFSINPQSLKNHVLLDIPELCYLTVNVYGCRANVVVRERTVPPEIDRDLEKTNIVAVKDGLVTRVELFGGSSETAAGYAVTEGQLLISGIVDVDDRGVHVTHGQGNVWARTWYELKSEIPTQVCLKEYTGRENTSFSLIFGTKRIKLYGKGGISYTQYDKITTVKKIHLPLGVPTPVSVERESYREYNPVQWTLPEDALKARLEKALNAELEARMCKGGEVKNTEISVNTSGDMMTGVLKVECLEQIGKSVTIPDE